MLKWKTNLSFTGVGRETSAKKIKVERYTEIKKGWSPFIYRNIIPSYNVSLEESEGKA